MKNFKFELGKVNLLVVLILVVISACILVFRNSPVKAWSAPIVTSLCAPDERNFSFNVTLTAENDYNMEWSFNSGFAGATSITPLPHSGDNTVTVPRDTHNGGDTWYIRFATDPNAGGSANADGTLCNSPTPTATPTATPEATPTPTATPVPTNTPSFTNDGGDGLGCAVNDCSGNVVGTSPGQVLGASVMGGTGSFDSLLYQAIMGLGAVLTSFGLKKALRKAN